MTDKLLIGEMLELNFMQRHYDAFIADLPFDERLERLQDGVLDTVYDNKMLIYKDMEDRKINKEDKRVEEAIILRKYYFDEGNDVTDIDDEQLRAWYREDEEHEYNVSMRP